MWKQFTSHHRVEIILDFCVTVSKEFHVFVGCQDFGKQNILTNNIVDGFDF